MKSGYAYVFELFDCLLSNGSRQIRARLYFINPRFVVADFRCWRVDAPAWDVRVQGPHNAARTSINIIHNIYSISIVSIYSFYRGTRNALRCVSVG
eukprot:4132225-Pyramimonas_sp.AAC.1